MAMNFGSYIAPPNNGGMPLTNFGGQNLTPIPQPSGMKGVIPMLKKCREKLAEEMMQLLEKQPLTKDDVCIIGELADAIKDLSTAEGMDAYGVKYLDADGSYGVRVPHVSYKHGYSGHSINDKMIASLEKLMDKAESDYERQQILDEINDLRSRM